MILLECVALFAKMAHIFVGRVHFLCRCSIFLLIVASAAPAWAEYTSWERGGGTNASLKFSELSQINLANTHKLELAWKYHSDNFGNVQTSPIFIRNAVITAARDGSVICLDATTGAIKWRSRLGVEAGRRGLTANGNNLFVPTSNGLYVLNLDDGSINTRFGKNGIFGKELSFLPPVIDGKSLLIANLTSIESYDLDNGSLNWITKLEKDSQIARMWSGFSYDEKNKLIFVVTSNAGWFLDEDMKEGGYFNSLVAVDAKSGKVKWYIKEIKHDLWDLDMVGPPMLADIRLNGKVVPVVMAVSKSGNTIFANRLTGELVYQSSYKTVTDKNEFPPITQLEFKLPQPFSTNYFNTEKDVTTISQEKRDSVLYKLRKVKQGNLLPVSPDYDVAMYGLHGGAEWSGGAFDPYKNILVVPSNKYPWILRAGYVDKDEGATVEVAKKNSTFMSECAQCHGENLRGWFQNELNGDIYIPSLINITSKISREKFVDLASFKKAHNFSNYIKGEYIAPYHVGYLKTKKEKFAKRVEKYCKIFGLGDEKTEIVKKYVLERFYPESKISELNAIAVSGIEKISSSDLSSIYKMLSELDRDIKKNNRLALEPIHQLVLDKDGLFGSQPPWGQLTAIDMNTGLIKWQRPFGEYVDPVTKKLIEGDMNFGGAIITKPGLIFAAGTRDGFARAYNLADGKELWKSQMPAAGSSPPITYESNGCQYVLFTATGGQFYGYTKSDTTVAYKLKDCPKK